MESEDITALVPDALKKRLPGSVRTMARNTLYKLDVDIDRPTLIVVADSLRADVFYNRVDRHFLEDKKHVTGFSDACWTIPSHEAIIRGCIPTNADVDREEILLNEYYKSAAPMPLQHPHSFGFTAMPYLGKSKYVSSPFLQYFDAYQCFDEYGNDCGRKVTDAAVQEIDSSDGSWFGLLNYGETHRPWSLSGENGEALVERAKTDESAQEEIKREMADGALMVLRYVEEIESVCPRGTQIIFTSDHGELIGENGAVGHGMEDGFHRKLFEVPVVWWTVG